MTKPTKPITIATIRENADSIISGLDSGSCTIPQQKYKVIVRVKRVKINKISIL